MLLLNMLGFFLHTPYHPIFWVASFHRSHTIGTSVCLICLVKLLSVDVVQTSKIDVRKVVDIEHCNIMRTLSLLTLSYVCVCVCCHLSPNGMQSEEFRKTISHFILFYLNSAQSHFVEITHDRNAMLQNLYINLFEKKNCARTDRQTDRPKRQ